MINRLNMEQWATILLLLISTTQTKAQPKIVDTERIHVYWDGALDYKPQCESGQGLVTTMTPNNVPASLNLNVEFVLTPTGTYKVTSELTNAVDGTRAIEQYTSEGFTVHIQYLCVK